MPSGVAPAIHEAAASSSPAVDYELAQRLYDGNGTPQDQKAAAALFERAAEAGFAPAQFKLGVLYQKGLAVEQDRTAAKRWYAAAAQAGNARAAHNLGVMDADASDGKPDYADAAKWFRRAAEMGVRDSQFNLATLYARGLGVEQDMRQAWFWFSLAATQGDAEAALKRDEVAAKMDKDSVRDAAFQLSLFKATEPDPSANDIPPRFTTSVDKSPRGGGRGGDAGADADARRPGGSRALSAPGERTPVLHKRSRSLRIARRTG